MTRFEKQSDHRMSMEAMVIRSNTFSQNWSTVLASIIGLCAVVGAIFLAWTGHYATGMSVFFGTLFSFLGTFVIGKKMQTDERQAKAAQQEQMRARVTGTALLTGADESRKA